MAAVDQFSPFLNRHLSSAASFYWDRPVASHSPNCHLRCDRLSSIWPVSSASSLPNSLRRRSSSLRFSRPSAAHRPPSTNPTDSSRIWNAISRLRLLSVVAVWLHRRVATGVVGHQAPLCCLLSNSRRLRLRQRQVAVGVVDRTAVNSQRRWWQRSEITAGAVVVQKFVERRFPPFWLINSSSSRRHRQQQER